MKSRAILFVSVSFILAGGVVWLMPYRVPAGDNFVGTESYKDLGEVEPGKVYRPKMTIVNPFDRPVTVTKIKTSCGCTGAKMDSMTIRPQGFQTLEIEIETPRTKGLVSVNVDVQFDNESTSTLRVFGVIR